MTNVTGTSTALSVPTPSPERICDRRPVLKRSDSSAVRFTPTAMVIEDMPSRPAFRRILSEATVYTPRTPPAAPMPSIEVITTPSGTVVANVPLNDERRAIYDHPPRSLGHIFGRAARYKPMWLLLTGSFGNCLYGTGTVAVERGLFPRRPIAPTAAPTHTLPPLFQPLFGSREASITAGVVGTTFGVLFAVTASLLFFQDARRLARRQNSAQPSYTRPNVYFGIHIAAIVLSVGYKFMVEALRDSVGPESVWVASIPGLVGQAAFAVTQAQAFSSCELYNRKMPLRYRSQIGFAARFTIGLYALVGIQSSVPYFNSYAREITRLIAQTATTLAYSLPLTTARIGRHAPISPNAPTPKTSWYCLNIMVAYMVGRFAAGYGPDLIQAGVFGDTLADGPNNTPSKVFGGASLLALGTGACVVSMMLYREDIAAYDPRKANVLVILGIAALMMVEIYRGMSEAARTTGDRGLLWAASVPGVIGVGLRLAVLPEMFAFSELRNGDLPLPYRYHWTEGCRAIGNMFFGLWAAMLAIPDFNSYGRETVGVLAGVLATLGMALPTTTSRRAIPQFDWPLSPGATPEAEVEGFALRALSRPQSA